MIAAAMFGSRRSGKFTDGSVGSGLLGRISEHGPLAPPGECPLSIIDLSRFWLRRAKTLRDLSFRYQPAHIMRRKFLDEAKVYIAPATAATALRSARNSSSSAGRAAAATARAAT
jgi:hypothetical protein